ncbi:MAG: hypothetical protein HFF06_04805 [Oscillospiraceae bacterium]|nr:hypothetical protein [Oscillospiraceae bacterium]
MGCHRSSAANNQDILLLAAMASIQIAQGLDTRQIETLAAFFDVLANNLALLIAPPCGGSGFTEERTAEEE